MLRNAIVFMLCGLSAACGVSSNVPENRGVTPVSSKPTSHPVQEADVLPQSTSIGGIAKTLSKRCGGSEMTLSCNGVDAECTQTSLKLSSASGKIIEIINPKELATYTSVGLGCATAKNNTHYFVVQYGELPSGCEFCEWFQLYDARGRQLTHSAPPILLDSTLPAGKQQIPNNQEFDKLSKKLGLNRPHMEFLN
jgi:hypothetical protein